MGCLAQVVNVIAPIMTAPGGEAWRQTIFYPFLHASKFGRGTVLRPVIDSPGYNTKGADEVPYLALTAVRDANEGLVLLAVNRGLTESLDLQVELRGFGAFSKGTQIVLKHDDLLASNTRENPGLVVPVENPVLPGDGGRMDFRLPPASWNCIRLTAA